MRKCLKPALFLMASRGRLHWIPTWLLIVCMCMRNAITSLCFQSLDSSLFQHNMMFIRPVTVEQAEDLRVWLTWRDDTAVCPQSDLIRISSPALAKYGWHLLTKHTTIRCDEVSQMNCGLFPEKPTWLLNLWSRWLERLCFNKCFTLDCCSCKCAIDSTCPVRTPIRSGTAEPVKQRKSDHWSVDLNEEWRCGALDRFMYCCCLFDQSFDRC